MQRKRIQRNLIKVPEHLDIFIFGSYLSSKKPNDFDLIIIYDSNIYTGSSIFENCTELINQIKETTGLEVDVTYLSKNEEKEIRFVEYVNAISL